MNARRALFVALVLLCEGLLLSLRFDTRALRSFGAHWWTPALVRVSELPRLAIACGTVLVLGGGKLSSYLDVARREESARRIVRDIVLHLASLGAFVVLSSKVLEGPADAAPRWVLPWLASGVASIVFLTSCIAPPRALSRFARRAAPLLALSFAAGVVAWLAGRVTQLLSPPLQELTSQSVFRLVSVFRRDAFIVPDAFVVGTPRFEVEIAPACSGYEGMGLIAVFVAIFLFTHRASLRFPASLLLLPLAVTAAALANVARLGLLVLVGEVSEAVAQGGFHSCAGAVMFSALALGTGFVALRVPVFAVAEPKAEARAVQRGTSAEAFLAPFIVFLAVQLLTGLAAGSVVDVLYPLRLVGAGIALWLFRERLLEERRDLGWVGPVIGIGVLVAWLVLAPADPDRTRALAKLASEAPSAAVAAWLAIRIVGTVVFAPLIEELAFRGYLLRRIAGRDFRDAGAWPIAISSAAFGLLHPHVVAGTVAGVAYALAAKRRGRLADAVLAHATTNALLVLYACTTGRWSAWL